MNLSEVFRATKARGEIAFIPYLTAGYPSVAASLDLVEAAASAGADAVEIGLPFSDPVADGPIIQGSSHEALRAGFRTRPFLEALAARPAAVPRILMSYLNPLLALGPSWCEALVRASVRAIVIPDLPPEESSSLAKEAASARIDLVLLAAPTTSDSRLKSIGIRSSGFVYAVGVVGTTGVRRATDPELPALLDRVTRATSLPVVAGFGLSEPAHLAAIRDHAAGAIVGSRLVEAVREGEDFRALVHSFKEATRRPPC